MQYPLLKKRLSFFTLTMFLSLFLTNAIARDDDNNEKGKGHIKGKVTTSDGKIASMVSVQLKGTRNATMTNDDGIFVLRNITPGNYQLQISLVGYQPVSKEANVEADKTTNLNIQLDITDLQLQEVMVKSRANLYKASKLSPTLRLNEPLIEAPQNIQVVSGKILSDQLVTAMGEGLIRNVSGATKIEHWGDLYARVNARGSRLAAFRNGMNITSNWGPLTEDMSFVERTEFVKGPAGFMMSNGEPSGLYNVVTKRPTGRNAGEINLLFGSYDFYRAAADWDSKLDKEGKLLYRINLMGQTKNSFRSYEYNNRYSVAPVISYKIDDNTLFTTEYIYQHAKVSNVGAFYIFSPKGYGTYSRNLTFGDPRLDPTIINDHNITLNLQHKFNDQWKLTAQAAYFNSKQIGSSLWTAADSINDKKIVVVPAVANDGKVVRNVSVWDAINEMKFGQVYLNGNVHTGIVAHRIIAGLDLGNKEYYADFAQSRKLDTYTSPFDPNNPSYGNASNGYPTFNRTKSIRERAGLGGSITQSYTGVYAQDELGFFSNTLRLTLAGRYTYVTQSDYGTMKTAKKFTPRFGLSYSIDNNTSVYALFDQSFVPQAGLRRDSQSVKPLTGNNMEIGIKRDWFGGRWNTTLSLYRILKNNQTASDPANTASEQFVVQFGQTTTKGIEFDTKGEIVRGLTMTANYAYTDSKITKADSSATAQRRIGNVVPGYAKHNANAWLNYQFCKGALKGFGISGGFSFQGSRTTWAWAGAKGQLALPDYFKLDGGLFWEKDKMRITCNVLNIADKYLYSGSPYANYYYYQAEPGRNWRLGIGYRF